VPRITIKGYNYENEPSCRWGQLISSYEKEALPRRLKGALRSPRKADAKERGPCGHRRSKKKWARREERTPPDKSSLSKREW